MHVHVRHRLRALGCVCAIGLALVGPSAPAGAASSAPPIRIVRRLAYAGAIPKSIQQEIARVRSTADLARVSPAARKVIQQPAIEVIEAGKASDAPAAYATGKGKLGRGCWQAWVSRKRENVLGWVLMSVRTTVRTVCTDGRYITSSPRTQRSIRGRWGWTFCRVDEAFTGFVSRRTHYGTSANAHFALNGACRGAPKVVHSELQLYGTGRYSWST